MTGHRDGIYVLRVMELLTHQSPWFVAGPLLGLLVVALGWVSGKTLGATGAFVGVERLMRRPGEGADWRAFLFVGILLGGLLSGLADGSAVLTLAHGHFDVLTAHSPATKAVVLVAAGAVMGFGARTAGGCTSGHGICGTARLSPRSLIATATFMVTAVFVAHGFVWMLGGSS